MLEDGPTEGLTTSEADLLFNEAVNSVSFRIVLTY